MTPISRDTLPPRSKEQESRPDSGSLRPTELRSERSRPVFRRSRHVIALARKFNATAFDDTAADTRIQ